MYTIIVKNIRSKYITSIQRGKQYKQLGHTKLLITVESYKWIDYAIS